MGQPLYGAPPAHATAPRPPLVGVSALLSSYNGLSSLVARLVRAPARDEAPDAAAGTLRADEQVARRPLGVVAADVTAEGRLATQAPEGGDARHAVDRPGVLATGSRDIGFLAVEIGQDLVDAPQGLFVHALP